jgi:hypothetical protein
LSGKIEYLHMSFGADSVSAGNPNNATPLALALRSRITDDIVRVGLNYRLVESGQKEPDDKPGMSKSRRRAKAPLPVPAWIWTGFYFGGPRRLFPWSCRPTLLQSGAVAGVRSAPHHRRCRLPER